MPNPFKRRGSSYHSADWKAWGIGLLGQLEAELSGDLPRTIALVGDIGSGKTTALDAYRHRIGVVRLSDVFLPRIDIGKRRPEQWSALHRDVYVELVNALGAEAHDVAVKKLGMSRRSTGIHLESHEIFGVIEQMIRQSVERGAWVHVLVDECQRPAEHHERTRDATEMHSWFEQLKNLAETISAGGGYMVITTTTSPWDTAPQHVRDRFVDLRAEPPTAAEIQAFIEEGLKHARGDAPARCEDELGTAIKSAFPELITPRLLHELLWKMWDKAHRAGAAALSREHVP